MTRDPRSSVGMLKVLSEVGGEVVERFVGPLSLKTMVRFI